MIRACLLVLILCQCQAVLAADYAVVVSRQSPLAELDAGKLKDVFLKKRNFGGGTRLIPVNLLGEDPVRMQFEAAVLHMERDEINRYWISSHFQGVTPPATQASLISIKRFVEKVEGAIGYLPLEMVGADLKVIHEF